MECVNIENISCKVKAVCCEQVLFMSNNKSFILYFQEIATKINIQATQLLLFFAVFYHIFPNCTLNSMKN